MIDDMVVFKGVVMFMISVCGSGIMKIRKNSGN